MHPDPRPRPFPGKREARLVTPVFPATEESLPFVVVKTPITAAASLDGPSFVQSVDQHPLILGKLNRVCESRIEHRSPQI